MSGALRIVNSGLRGARENLSLTAALAELHRQHAIPDTLRFQHFRPSAIVGRHQHLSREVHLEECARRAVETARRMTGGGAIYMGPGLLGWELVVDRARTPGPLEHISRTLCTGLASGLSRLGIEARYRPRNDVEVHGRKISGTGGYVDGRSLVFQGTVLIDFDVADMAAVLRLPVDKLDRKGLSALAQRVTSLTQLLANAPALATVQQAVSAELAKALGMEPQLGALSQQEEDLGARYYNEEIGTDAFVEGEDLPASGSTVAARHATGGGLVEAAMRVRPGADPIIERAWITGDMFVTPPRSIPDLEAALVGIKLSEAEQVARTFLDGSGAEMMGASCADLANVLGLCWEAHRSQRVSQ